LDFGDPDLIIPSPSRTVFIDADWIAAIRQESCRCLRTVSRSHHQRVEDRISLAGVIAGIKEFSLRAARSIQLRDIPKRDEPTPADRVPRQSGPSMGGLGQIGLVGTVQTDDPILLGAGTANAS
jgi:hypothetical protein